MYARGGPVGVFAGLVLAAGASSRLGRAKALLPLAGEAAVARVARVLAEAGAVDVVVVGGAEIDGLRTALPPSARLVEHRDWARGRTGSVQAGLRALAGDVDVLVWPVDHPAVDPTTVLALAAGSGAIRVPVHEGRRGHPTLFGAALREEILALQPDEPLRHVLQGDPRRVVDVPVVDPGIHLNIDHPADVARLDEHVRRMGRARPGAR